MLIHPFSPQTLPPERFTYPFDYEPHPLCIQAAEVVKQEIQRINPSEGKMFGVLIVKQGEGLAFLAAYSGLLEGRNDWDYFVPPVFDAQDPNGHFKQQERKISALNQNQSSATQSQHRQLSQDLQLWLFQQYQFLNAKGESKNLVDIWQDYHCSPKIQQKYPLPPGGTGDCCAPKLLQYAYSHDLKPVCMAEFWWGPSPKSEIRHHGQFYPACRGKCLPILTWMLQGLEVDPIPQKEGINVQSLEVIYEDEALAVINKPSGLLSVPGKDEDYSVALLAKAKWPGSIPVHRLDMGTSGLLIIAKTKNAYQHLQEQFVKHTVEKRYIAVVKGQVKESEGRIDLPLRFDPMNRPRQIVDYQHGKSAVTEYKVLDTSQKEHEAVSLLALYPHTGRTHQLRMHCAHEDGLGCPILGDELYGQKDYPRLCLHCDQITFTHPLTDDRMHFELPNPFGDIFH